jgi:hypothetical protein
VTFVDAFAVGLGFFGAAVVCGLAGFVAAVLAARRL